jgi:DNA-binding response OmpR family regulator
MLMNVATVRQNAISVPSAAHTLERWLNSLIANRCGGAMPDPNSKLDPYAPPGALRVLLIQDDRNMARLLTDYLGSHGFRVTTTDSAHSVVRAKAEKWDLIILDLMPTGSQGQQVLRQLRAFSIVPLLVLVGEVPDNELIASLQCGVDSYLSRTASARELVAHIRALSSTSVVTERPRSKQWASDQTAPSVAGLKLKPAEHAVNVNGAAIRLTALEFELLASLMRHAGNICSRAQLLSEVRSRGFEVSEQLIDAHFAGLRRKFRASSQSARFIFKIRGVGYVLMDPNTLKA